MQVNFYRSLKYRCYGDSIYCPYRAHVSGPQVLCESMLRTQKQYGGREDTIHLPATTGICDALHSHYYRRSFTVEVFSDLMDEEANSSFNENDNPDFDYEGSYLKHIERRFY